MIDALRLSPRQTRTALDLVTAAMIISVAFALAGLTWRLAGHAGTGAITVPSAGKPVRVSNDAGPAIALSPFGKATLTEASEPTTIAAELKGVIFALPTSLSTAFIKLGDAEPQNYSVGDTLGSATIAAIRRDRVILNNGGRMEYLAFPDPAGTQSSGAGAPATASPVASAPDAAPTDLLSRFDAQPTAQGYRIGDNAPPGLSSGDVITSVNGQNISDPDSAQSALAAAAASGSAQVQILRNGKTITVTVPTR